MSNKKVIIPDDYQDYLYRLTYHALSGVVPYIPKRITPNQITMMAFLSAMIGNVLLVLVHTPAAFLYWTLFNFLWFLLDALDGMHARYSGQTSEYGAYLDHTMDVIYFLFMLTTFTFKFDLSHLFYVYIVLLRSTAATLIFIAQYHTKRLLLSRFSGGLEFLLLTSAMILSYAYPHFNPLTLTQNPALLKIMDLLSLQQGAFMKLTLLVYFIGIPVNFIFQCRTVKATLG